MSIKILDPNPTGAPAILFLHGLGADSESWIYQLEFFSSLGHRPIAPDIPGFGESLFSNGRWNLKNVSLDLHRSMLDLGVRPFVLVGISMGGAIALQMALDFPNDVHQLVLTNTFACLRPHRVSELFYLLRRYLIAQVSGVERQAELVANRIFPGEKDIAFRQALIEKIVKADQQVYKQAMRSLATFDVRRRLKEIHCPTLVITGEKDTTIAHAIQYELSRGIRGSKQFFIPNGGHAVAIDQPDLFNRCVSDFLLERISAHGI